MPDPWLIEVFFVVSFFVLIFHVYNDFVLIKARMIYL